MWEQTQVPRHYELNPLGMKMVYCLESDAKGKLVPLRVLGSFFDFIPSRLGRNTALDDAVACLCSMYSTALLSSDAPRRDVYQKYARALSSLRSYLGDSTLQMESETLCATILLQVCEVSFFIQANFRSNVISLL